MVDLGAGTLAPAPGEIYPTSGAILRILVSYEAKMMGLNRDCRGQHPPFIGFGSPLPRKILDPPLTWTTNAGGNNKKFDTGTRSLTFHVGGGS